LENRPPILNFNYPIPKHMVFKHPFTMMIAGPSGSGKTVFVARLLEFRDQVIDTEMEEILWCHGMSQPFHEQLKKLCPLIKFHEGLPDPTSFSGNTPKLIILDDLMNETKGNIVANLFAKGSHHTNTSVIYIVQNMFPKNKEHRDISLNTKYIVAFKNPRDCQQISTLASQMKKSYIVQAYKEVTKKPHGYLMIDLTQDALDEHRTRTDIFPNDSVNIVILPDNMV
jgi:ABC-type dipeptide/oligopeptide/nickel transport system ATPase component